MAETAPWESAAAETAPWETASTPTEGDVFSEGGAQAANAGTVDVNPVVGGAEALLHAATANTTGLIGPAVGGARYWAGRATGESAEEARQRGDEMSAAIAPYTIYDPVTKSGRAVTDAAGHAIMAPFEKAANVIESPMSDAARQSVEEAAGDVNRTAAMLPFLGVTPEGAAAVKGAAYDSAARSAAIDAARAAPPPRAPPAPSGGLTPEQFAPQPPKPKITPRAGESVQAAAARQGVPTATPEPPATPSAAPGPKGAPAPASVTDPGFFEAPDNPDLKSGTAGPQEQAARQAAVERGAPTLPQVRDSAITNNYEDQGRDWTGKQAGDKTAVAQIAAEGQALHAEAGRISQGTGGQLGSGESADTVRGKAYQDWHDSTVAALDQHIKQTYADEDAAAKQIASPGSNLKGVLTDDSLIDNANAGAVRSSTIALGKKMGVDLTDPNAQLNAYQIENLRKHANSTYGSAPRLAQAIKNAADADLPPGAYVNARRLQQLKSDMFDNRDGINRLGASKDIDPATGRPRPENRPVKAPDVMKTIEGMAPEQVGHIVRTMKRSSSVLEALGDHDAAAKIGDKAYKAAQQLQSHFTERWVDEASKGGGWNTRRAHQFLRGNQETLANVLSPEQMHQIRNVHNAANVLDLDKRYKGAFAQFSSGSSWLRQRLGRTAEGIMSDLVPPGMNTLGELTGASEGIRRTLGGSENKPPKNFTRPLGQRIPGQGGWIGNQPEMSDFQNAEHVEMATPHEHFVDENGDHNFTTASGKSWLKAEPQEDGGLRVRGSYTDPTERGRGNAGVLYQRAAEHAISNGGSFTSDAIVSKDAARRWTDLRNQGYRVSKDPNAKLTSNGGLINEGDNPVFTINGRNKPASYPPTAATAAADIRAKEGELPPLGARIGGGKQRGAVGNLRPKDEAPLAGAPAGDRPNGTARRAAAAYMKSAGRDYTPLSEYRYVPPEVATDVANAYDAMKHDPTNPKVKAAYDAFKAETLAQYKQMQRAGVKVTLDPNYPYKVPREVHEDVRSNNHMSIFPTEQGFGGPTASGDDVVNHVVAVHMSPEKELMREMTPARREEYARELVGLDAGGDYKKIDYPLDQIHADQPISSGIVDRYAKRDTPFPAIVMDSDGKIRDGNHRIAAARQRGDKTISAYVPIDTTTGEMAEGARPTGFDPHPMLEKSPVKMGGKDATYNDLFRAVHDYYGHVAEGNGFRANGEYNAWRAHRTMYSDAARPAMDSETLGQNSWVNSGPHAAVNKDASQTATVYAEQKAGLLPPKVVQSAESGVGAPEHHVTNLLTPEERNQLRADTTQRLMDAFHGLPATEEYSAAALAGAAKRGWYANSAKAISNVFGPDAPRFSGVLAAMSPQTSVEMNFHNALRTFVNWDKAGRPTDPGAIRQIMRDSVQKQPGGVGVLPAWENNTVRALTAEDPGNLKLSGPKVHSFYSNLTDKVNEVTNDAWMATFAKLGDIRKLGGALNQSGPGKSATYLAFSAKVRAAAKQISALTGEAWTPREVQETVWSWAKTAFEHAEEQGDKTIPELVKQHGITDELIRSTPDFHQLFGSPEHRGFLESSRYAGNAERLASGEKKRANAAYTGKARAVAAKTLRPHLLSAAQRLESVRQEQTAARTEEAPF